jgi:MoaA/NifB/PqqE/SkfB family radical SAM enzyme
MNVTDQPKNKQVMMTDNYKIDSHKLIYHPSRVAQWLESRDEWEMAKKVYPIYMEVSPAGGCNHRCKFCAMDYIGYNKRTINLNDWKRIANDLATNGVKSIMFAGEGEPFLNKDINHIAKETHNIGIDVAFTTNGVLMKKRQSEAILPFTTWIKASIDAGNPKTYADIHNTKESDFYTLMRNLSTAVRLRNDNRLPCTIGGQMILLPENVDEVKPLTLICRDELGLDYLVIKPYSQHLHSNNQRYESLEYNGLRNKMESALGLSTEYFKIIYRANAFEKHLQKAYKFRYCYSIPFYWAHVMANLDVFACSSHLLDMSFHLGNLSRNSFKEIWEGEKRKELFKKMRNFDIRQCRINCRMTFINEYLWELTNPHSHVNFI